MSVVNEWQFPNPRMAGAEGLLCVGGSLKVESLLTAYSQGIFPWPQEGLPLLWFSPPERGVLDFERLHLGRSFLKLLRSADGLQITFDKAFASVIRACAAVPRSHETGTWILPEMQKAYIAFHKSGYAHSVECWRGDELVGGLYGVYVGGVFSAESMFHLEDNASKRCLHAMIIKLRQAGLTWIDTQMTTPVVQTFGGKSISRDEFLARLERAHQDAPMIDWQSGIV